jgi:hypothetical protein
MGPAAETARTVFAPMTCAKSTFMLSRMTLAKLMLRPVLKSRLFLCRFLLRDPTIRNCRIQFF